MLTRPIKNRRKRYLAGRQGFTLIEVMVAVLLLLIAMAGIVPFFLSGLSQASAVRYKSVATNVARERMEQIRQLDYREITQDPLLGTTLTQRFGSTTTQRGMTFNVTYLVPPVGPGELKQVTVNVGWTAPPKVSTASITTMIHQQFLGPRGASLEITPTLPDPLGTPFPAITGSRGTPRTTTVRYHIAQADWSLVYNNLGQLGMAARNVYMRFVFFDDNGQSVSLGDPANDFKISNSCLRYSTGTDGKVNDVWFEYNFDANVIPDGYWELRAIVYNEYDEPGNVWRLRVRVEMGPPAAPTTFAATPQADNQTVVLTWVGGPERDRAYYVLERFTWVVPESGIGGWSAGAILASHLDPKASTFTDLGNAGDKLDPWGDGPNRNLYQYRLSAVDICNPGLAGPAAQAETEIPPSVTTTTTTLSTTTTVSTTTTSTSTTTTLATYSANIVNTLGMTYGITIHYGKRKGSNSILIYSGSVGPSATLTLPGLQSGDYWITATPPPNSGPPNEKAVVESFSMPAQNGLPVLTIM